MLHNSHSATAPPEAGAGLTRSPTAPLLEAGGGPPAAAGENPAATLTCAKVREWAERAQPNARLPYGAGAAWANCARWELRELVLKLQEKGLVTSHFVRGRDGGADLHVLQRTHRPWLKGMKL